MSSDNTSLLDEKIKNKEAVTNTVLMVNSEGHSVEQEIESELCLLESLCFKCYENGNLKLLLYKLPQFQQVIISSFECLHCGYCDNKVESAGSLYDKGCEITLNILNAQDFNRQIVKSDYATFKLIELDFEIPSVTQRGKTTTIEGLLSKSLDDLKETTSLYVKKYESVEAELNCLKGLDERSEKKEAGNQIKQLEEEKTNLSCFIEKMNKFVADLKDAVDAKKLPLTAILDDPSGTSFIQSFAAPKFDDQMKLRFYKRTKEQLIEMGFSGGQEETKISESESKNETKFGADIPENFRVGKWDFNVSVEENLQQKKEDELNLEEEVLKFNVNCSSCGKPVDNNVCQIDIPGFRKCLIMSFLCEYCGNKGNEIRPAGAYGDKGRKWTLNVENTEDLNRDVLKSDTASVKIPHIDFEMSSGTQGGVFTTVEGLLLKMADNLSSYNPFSIGDSALPESKNIIRNTIDTLRSLADDSSKLPFTIIIDDPADQSFVGRRYSNLKSEASDTNLIQEEYERTDEQNDQLGLKDMNVDV